MNKVPQEIRDISQWTYSFSVTEIKRPKHSHYKPDGSLSFRHAVTLATQNRSSFGFYTTNKDPYVIGDIDHIADPNNPSTLPIPIANLLMNYNMYSEISPSGEGIRFVAKLPSVEDKKKLRGKIFYTREPLVNKREAQINIAPPWLRFTGNATSYSADNIPVIPLEDWETAFTMKYVDDDLLGGADEGVTHVTPKEDGRKPPPIAEFMAVLKSLPLDQNARIRRAYEKVFNQAYSHYDYWLRIIMGVHNYATLTGQNMDCLTHVVEWSKTDEESFSSEEDVITKWQSLATKPDEVSYHTVFAIGYANLLKWPKPKPLTKAQLAAGITSKEPINSEFSNFKEMVQFYGITLFHDVHSPAKMYITGDEDIMKKYFESRGTKYYYEKYRGVFSEKSLVSAFHIMSQDMGFTGLGHQQTQQHIRDLMYQIRKTIDMVKMYFDTPFEDLPPSYQDNKNHLGHSTVEFMFQTLELDYLTSDPTKERMLYFKYYKSWLMGMVRNLYWPNDIHMNNCILLLTGAEQIRKTSHFRYMLPKFMRDERIAFTTHGFATETSMRDLIKLASGNSLLVWDEIEQYLNAETESNFKKLIDGNPTKFIDKYETIEASYKPIAMYGGTSNQREFRLSDTGSRRLFHIPVKWVDTDKLNTVCWWRIVNDLKHEIEKHKAGDPPWLLSKEQLKYQATLHTRVTAKSGLELVIRDMFDFDTPCIIPKNATRLEQIHPLKSPYFQSTQRIMDAIFTFTGGREKINRAQLTRVMHNLCGTWTNTKTTSQVILKPKMKITRGLCTYGGQHQLWVVPEKKNPYNQD